MQARALLWPDFGPTERFLMKPIGTLRTVSLTKRFGPARALAPFCDPRGEVVRFGETPFEAHPEVLLKKRVEPAEIRRG